MQILPAGYRCIPAFLQNLVLALKSPDETECFMCIANCLARLFRITTLSLWLAGEKESTESDRRKACGSHLPTYQKFREVSNSFLQHEFLCMVRKSRYTPPGALLLPLQSLNPAADDKLLEHGTPFIIQRIATTESLYKVFERC